MGWIDMPELKKKEYETLGTVTISTEEYKDLIDCLYETRKYADNEHSDWRKQYEKANDLEKKCKELTAKLDDLNCWLDSDDTLRQKLKIWKLEQLEKMTEEE